MTKKIIQETKKILFLFFNIFKESINGLKRDMPLIAKTLDTLKQPSLFEGFKTEEPKSYFEETILDIGNIK